MLSTLGKLSHLSKVQGWFQQAVGAQDWVASGSLCTVDSWLGFYSHQDPTVWKNGLNCGRLAAQLKAAQDPAALTESQTPAILSGLGSHRGQGTGKLLLKLVLFVCLAVLEIGPRALYRLGKFSTTKQCLLFILRPGLVKFPRLTWNSLCNPGALHFLSSLLQRM